MTPEQQRCERVSKEWLDDAIGRHGWLTMQAPGDVIDKSLAVLIARERAEAVAEHVKAGDDVLSIVSHPKGTEPHYACNSCNIISAWRALTEQK